jgi:hypothetical protein
MDADEMEFLVAMNRIAKVDRDTYRELRRRMWELIAATHAEQTPAERAAWLKNAS